MSENLTVRNEEILDVGWHRAGTFPHEVEDLEITVDLDFYVCKLLSSNFITICF